MIGYNVRGAGRTEATSVNRTPLVLVLGLASVALARRLPGQCPDGSPPPCGRAGARPAPLAANSVAVLYFEARDTADAYLADGLTEDLTSLLGSVASVQVKAPGVVRRAQRLANRLQPGDLVMEHVLALVLVRAGDSGGAVKA